MKGRLEDYRGYDQEMSKKLNMTIEKMYGKAKIFRKRNLGIINMMNVEPKSIFEFACAYGFLAKEIIKKFPSVQYVCTNFDPDVVKYVNNQGIHSYVFDANDIPRANLNDHDTFVCTSLEHLKKDREIISSLPRGSMLYFCVTNSPDKTHMWTFEDEHDIHDRYRDVMNLIDIKVFLYKGHYKKIIGKGMIWKN